MFSLCVYRSILFNPHYKGWDISLQEKLADLAGKGWSGAFPAPSLPATRRERHGLLGHLVIWTFILLCTAGVELSCGPYAQVTGNSRLFQKKFTTRERYSFFQAFLPKTVGKGYIYFLGPGFQEDPATGFGRETWMLS